ncbi:hypothetical protein MCOR25_010670 [Pyricularia grisea]|uniref:Uncharacterized protein n=1 Tax=Pyricularia grisea TaxID=148305 RepID=A0A6P8BLK9_PYRGI|nr:uncharacterized protein PgNI_01241 [Pyricularia grisea]KAI6349466.1 hypothetical protein MCOR25_010670 [Pyricularia grisea]TLD17703.1 hypothetical protein PgNI_01241 [Pyricularia grisea]
MASRTIIRLKLPQKKTQVKPPVKRRRCSDTSSSSLDLSDDGGYSAVEDVSDDEDDDEEDVYAAEAEHIINRVTHPKHTPSSSRPQLEDSEDEDEDEEDEADDENEEEEEDEDDQEDDLPEWNGIVSDPEDEPLVEQPPVERHVRFTGVPDSDSDDTLSDVSDYNKEFFPDIFVEQASLDPAFRRQVEQDPDDTSSVGSFWDFEDANDHMFAPQGHMVTEDATESQLASAASTPARNIEELDDSSESLDGYETDGETTEEDIPTEPLIRKKQIRRIEPADGSSDSDTASPAKSAKTAKTAKTSIQRFRSKAGKPRVGHFDLDNNDSKPVGVMDPVTRKMIIFTPSKTRRMELSQESLNWQDSEINNMIGMQQSPILSNSGSMMFGAMFSNNAMGDFMNNLPVGPEEAFYPLNSDAMSYSDGSTGSENMDFVGDEGEKDLKLDDFLIFDSNDTGDEAETANPSEDENDGGATPTPARRHSVAASSVSDATVNGGGDIHPLLAHFDRNSEKVGAFRRDQVNKQLILSDMATEESLLFSNGYSNPIRGVRSDSLNNITAPLTPVRRRKSSVSAYQHMISSPLDSVAQKRKASSNLNEAHKRQRSISDVRSLQI